MKLLTLFALACGMTGSGLAAMPTCYESVNSVTWLVQNIDAVKPGWVSLGLTDIQEYPNIVMTGQDHGKPVSCGPGK